MIHELRMYTLEPGTTGAVVEASGTVGQRVRATGDYGKLEGHWSSEVGLLNQFVHLWGYDDIADMAAKRGALGALEAWRKEYLPLVRPHTLSQRIRLMSPAIDMKTPSTEGNLHELRIYRLKPGRAAEWCRMFADVMPVREKYSQNLGLWTTVAPDPNEVVHLWSYETFEKRLAARKAAQADPEMKDFYAYTRESTVEQHSLLLMPSPYSPRK